MKLLRALLTDLSCLLAGLTVAVACLVATPVVWVMQRVADWSARQEREGGEG
jgi:F0F1-type ATP synthase membrane subunit c/vacuolar-type H+-ATPase subunit K